MFRDSAYEACSRSINPTTCYFGVERSTPKSREMVDRAMRQKLLALPLNIGNRFGDREVPIREVVEYAKRLINETLVECSKLPECAEPDWLEQLEEEG